jgi:hypothetical protein
MKQWQENRRVRQGSKKETKKIVPPRVLRKILLIKFCKEV